MVHISRKISADAQSDETNENKTWVKSSQGHIEGVRKILRSESKKRRRRSPGNKFGIFNVNQAAPTTCMYLVYISKQA